MNPVAKANFHRVMSERRQWRKGSMEYNWRTKAARQYYWMAIGKPVCEWED